MTPAAALARIVHCLDRAPGTGPRSDGFKVKAWHRALEVVRATPPGELRSRDAAGTLTDLPGIGASSARVIHQALAGAVPDYLVELEAETVLTVSPDAAPLRAALRGELHCHSTWSDGGASIRDMAEAARALGHDWLAITDHSARLTVAHGLDRARLLAQLDEIAALAAELAPFRLLTGIEVDILVDGTLDLDDELLGRLDVVVASVHSKLRMESRAMTERMVRAVASPHVDVLGHCTGRMVGGKRPPSSFDADYVFAACAAFGTAVEINSRPERLDPPDELLAVAIEHGCTFTIDADAHATGQLEWQVYGCEIAARHGLGPEQILNTRDVDGLLAWTAAR
ncbi:MAG: PHP domain-containing protein [Acidimicrobiales bacterium]